jgi:hypothetical protein
MPRKINDSLLFYLTHVVGQFRRGSWRSGERAILISETNRLQSGYRQLSCKYVYDPIYDLLHAPTTLAKEP